MKARHAGLILVGLGFIVAAAAIGFALSNARAAISGPSRDSGAVPVAVEFDAPAVTLEDLSGNPVSLSDYLGRVVLVNLWATWCPPCAAEMPLFERYYETHGDQGLVVVAINDGESAGAVEDFVIRNGLTFPVWLDPTYEATDRAFKTGNLPSSYVIDRGGTVRLMWFGGINEENLEKYVTPMVKE